MGLKKIGEATAPRSFGTGGAKITPKNNVSNTLNNVQSTYKPTSRKENAFDKLFDLANEVVSSLPKSAPKFTLPTTAKGMADMASAIQKQQADKKERSITAELAFARRTRAGGDVIQDLQKKQRAALEQQFASNDSNFLKDLGWGIGYGAERIGAGLLGAAEGVSDFVGSTGSKALEYLTSFGYSNPNDVSEFFRRQAENYLNTSPTSAYQQSIEDRYQPTDLQRALGDVNETVAAMLPSIGLAALTGGGSAAGQLVSGASGASKVLTGSNLGKTIMGVQAAGGGAQEAYQEGADIGQALTFGAASGLLETTTEALVGGIPGLGKGAASELVGKVISNPIVQKAVDIVGEGGEEAISAIVTPYLQRAIYDPSAENASLEEIAQNAVMGMVAAGVLQGGIELPSYLSSMMNTGRNVNTYDAFTQQQASILEQIANEMAAERVSQIPGFERQTTQPQVQTTVPAQPRMQAQNQQQTQAQQSTALLDQLRQQTSTLSNRQAEQVLSDRQAVATLQQDAGLDLSAQTTLAQRRTAVKQSFEQYAAQQQQAQADQNRADMMNSLGENGKKAFVSAVRQTGDADATYPEFARAYAAGLSGSDQTADLSPAAQSAYYAGQNDAATRAEVKAPTMTAGFTESEYSGDLSESDRAFYDVLGKATGTKISVVAPTGDGGYNGYYQDGEIRIAADAEEPGQVVVAHEATHRLQEIAPEAYTKFRDYAVAAVAGQDGADALISAYQSRYADYGVTLTQDAAMDEIAADYAQRLMIDEEAIRRVVADDRSLAQKFVDTIKDLIQRVKRAFSGKEARAQIAQLEKARDLWLDALKEGSTSQQSSATGEKLFSLKSPVETTNTLVALHNLTEKKLLSSLRLGGFPMPSIAVTRTDIPHTNFGDITLVMDKRSVDPKASKKNVVYSADAWTPTFPQVEYEADAAVSKRISSRLNSLSKQIDDVFKQDLSRISYDMNDLLNRYGGEKALIENVMDNYGLKAAYLEEQGEHITAETAQREVEKGYNPDRSDKYDAVVEALGTSDPKAIGQIPLKDLREQYGDALEQAFPGMTKSAFRMSGILRQVQAYLEDQGGTPVYETVTDMAATRKAVDNALDSDGYKAWVQNLFSGIEGASGIYNNKDRFTPSGNRRSFQQTHYPVTLDNIVKAMKGQNNGNSKNVSGFFGVKSLRAGLAERFKSVADMHKLEGRLQNLTEDEVKAINDALDRRLIDISEEIAGKSNASYLDLDAIGSIMVEVADGGTYTIDSIIQKFNQEYGYNISNELAAKVRDLLFDVSQMPVNIFEAKPERSVGFDEVLAAIVPDNSSSELISSLNNAGVETIEYRSGDNADRLEKVNSIDSAKFSLKGTSQLQRQVQNLQERNAYLKEQMKRSTSIKTDRKKTAAYAKQLLKSYESQYGADALTSDLLFIYDEFANAGSDVDMESLTASAREVASRILEQSVREDAELYNEYSVLRNYLRTTKINVPKSIHADLDMVGGYNQFRKSNMGRMKLSSSDGASIDTVYQELAQQYPGLFDETAYTNPADQLINMADVLDGIQPIIENPYSSDMEMATRFVASEILESYFDIPQQKPTFADRQQARVESAKAAGNRRVAELREANRQNIAGIREQNRERISALRASNQQQIAQLREQGRQQVKAAIQRERTRRAEQIQALKEKFSAKETSSRERRAAREVRNKIERHVRALSTRLLDPTDSRNVPDELRPPVAALLEAINLESNYTFDPDTLHEVIRKDGKSGGMTGKHLAADDARGVATKRTKAFIDLRNAYQQIIKDGVGDMVIDPALLGDQAWDFQGNFDKVISMYDKRLADMSLSELETVLQTVRAVEFSISTAGKNLAQSKFAGTVEWAKAMQSENAGKVQRSSTKRHWTLDLLTPITYFSRFGDSGVEVYRMLRNAQDRQQQMITDIRETTREIVSPADARKYRYETHEFVTDGGQELTLTTAQIMSIYELSKRKQAQGHLLSGGIYQPEVPGTKIRRGTEAIHLTEGDLATIVGTLTDKQGKVADDLQNIMATTLADWGNDASMKAYGYKKFTGADYWPISVAREGVKTTVENSGMNTRSISNIGLAKATVPKASNPLNIEDAFSTFTQHAGDMTDYAAYLLPMEDISRLFNFRFKDGDGNYTGQTIKGLLNRVGGAQSDSYWIRLVDDIQNGTAARTDSQFSAGIQNIIGKAKGAAVGANLRVVAQQPTAFFRAAAILSPADLSRGVAGAPTKGSGWAKALKWAPIAQRKQIGGFEIGNGVRLETELFGDLSQGGKRALNKLDDISSTPAAKADQITWGRIWNACEWQISKNKSLAKGSDEYYQATAKLFTRVIDESQVVDGVLQRSQIMRSNSALNKMATSFMGEPTMSLNMMMRAWDTMRYETDPKKRNALRRKFARAGTTLVVSGVVNAMVQSLVDAERDKDPDKKYWGRVFSAFTGLTGEEETPWDKAIAVVLNSNVSGNINPLGQIPYVKDVLSLLQGYDVTRMDADAIGDFITAGEAVAKNIGGDGPRTPAYAAKELLNAGAKVFGISIGNLWRDASGIVNAIAVETDNTALMYEMAKAGYNLSNTTNKSRFLDIAFRAREAGDTETYSRIAEDLISSGTVVDMDEFEKAMASRLKKTEAFAKAQASTQEELQKKIESTSIYSRFDSKTKEKAAEKIEAYAYAKQMGEENPDFDLPDSYNWVEKADSGASVGLTPDEYILFDLAYNMLKSDEEEGGLSKQEKAIDLLEGMNLTDSERSYLFGTKYESDKNNPWK